MQRALPALAGGNAALRIEIKEDFVLPAVRREPVAQGDGLGVVGARMAQKDARHTNRLERTALESR